MFDILFVDNFHPPFSMFVKAVSLNTTLQKLFKQLVEIIVEVNIS